MAKIANDKYYTPQHIVDLVIQRTKEVIGLDNITEFIEPGAGNGAFLDKLYELGKPVYAYDLCPEREDIKEQDYLLLREEYKKGRCIIGNPPFGRANCYIKKFFNKSIKISDYIAFILPISQLNNNNELFQFDLIYSEDIGIQIYSGKKIHCCLNIYKKPISLKVKPVNKLKDIEFIGWRKSKTIKSDFKIICYGNRMGDVVFDEEYSNCVGVVVKNKSLKFKVIEVLNTCKWREMYHNISTPNLLQWQIIKYLKEQIPELE